MRYSLIAMVLFSLAGSSVAQRSAHRVFADSGYSSVVVTHDSVDGYETTDLVTKTRTYNLQHFWIDTNLCDILITETSTQHSQSGAEATEGKIALSAAISDGGNFSTESWHHKIDANVIAYYSDYFQAVKYGCCGALDDKKLFRYSDGKRVMHMTSDLYQVRIPNTRLERYIGYWDSNSADFDETSKDSLLVGIVTYADPSSLKTQRLFMRVRSRSSFEALGYDHSTVLSLVTTTERDSANYQGGLWLDLWSQDKNDDPQSMTGFAIGLKIEGEQTTTLTIPIRADKLDISGVRSEWFDLELR